MKNLILTAFIILFAASILPASAQYRNHTPRPGDWTGSIIKTDNTPRSILGGVDFSMHHSYEMNFVSFSGQGYNQNMYTNTMVFGFTDRLRGRVDLALAHSPFGNGLMTQGNEVRFMVRNAELNYQFGKNSNLSIHFSQMPQYGYGYGYGQPYGMYGNMHRRGHHPYHPFY